MCIRESETIIWVEITKKLPCLDIKFDAIKRHPALQPPHHLWEPDLSVDFLWMSMNSRSMTLGTVTLLMLNLMLDYERQISQADAKISSGRRYEMEQST